MKVILQPTIYIAATSAPLSTSGPRSNTDGVGPGMVPEYTEKIQRVQNELLLNEEM
jgi:hypothetical protein